MHPRERYPSVAHRAWCYKGLEFLPKAKEIQDFERAGANRVVLWLSGQDLDSILPEMEELARTVLS